VLREWEETFGEPQVSVTYVGKASYSRSRRPWYNRARGQRELQNVPSAPHRVQGLHLGLLAAELGLPSLKLAKQEHFKHCSSIVLERWDGHCEHVHQRQVRATSIMFPYIAIPPRQHTSRHSIACGIPRGTVYLSKGTLPERHPHDLGGTT